MKCTQCGKEAEELNYEDGDRHFCSQKCLNKWGREMQEAQDRVMNGEIAITKSGFSVEEESADEVVLSKNGKKICRISLPEMSCQFALIDKA